MCSLHATFFHVSLQWPLIKLFRRSSGRPKKVFSTVITIKPGLIISTWTLNLNCAKFWKRYIVLWPTVSKENLKSLPASPQRSGSYRMKSELDLQQSTQEILIQRHEHEKCPHKFWHQFCTRSTSLQRISFYFWLTASSGTVPRLKYHCGIQDE